MRVDSARFIPVLIRFADGEVEDSWGRFIELGPGGGRLITRRRVRDADPLLLSFDLPGERLEGLPARVRRSWTDADGYCVASFGFPDAEVKEKLGRILRRILSTA
ncbi:MAG: hypothetical protein A2X36_14465 [Elusimicrobia bacterium GWA2_69_24]|nr:MAG: hypothetical protein A2X36_14465 [Elusimicrobia bacterium GWA2_69_24]HBL18404.1 hypothetical protein [Elusimicrobiota bacterium]